MAIEWKSDTKFRIAANRQIWHGFNLSRGHIFGTYAGGYYVSTGEIAEFRRGVAYYTIWYESGNANCYRWTRSTVNSKTQLGKLIGEAARRSSGVDYQKTTRNTYMRMMGDYVGKTASTIVII